MLKIPDVSDISVTLGEFDHVPPANDIPDEFKDRRSPFCNAVSGWFFGGAKRIPNGVVVDGSTFTAKQGVEVTKALRAIAAALKSFEPSHEEKIAACGYMLSQWFDADILSQREGDGS